MDLHEVQSLILAPNRAEQLELVFLSFDSRADLCTFARDAADVVTSADEVGDAAGSSRAVHVGLTGAALRLADVGDRTYDALPSAFTRGMVHAAPRLGDRGDSDPKRWVEPFGPQDPEVHAVVLIADGAETTSLGPHLEVVERWHARRRPGDVEPFGFRDGISDPVILGSGRDVTPGNGIWDAEGRCWRAVRTGEALLGHADESGAVAGHPDAAHLERDGSYLVVRKLEQHARRFREACAQWAADLAAADGTHVSGVDVAAGLVGRHQDGRLLGLEQLPADTNDFLYRDERSAVPSVPPSAHIRRANPRDAIGSANAIVPRHQLFRRGLPYDDDPGAGTEDRDGDEGLLFLAVCADLRRQFEFMQAEWMQDGNRFGLGEERDPLVGQRGPGDGVLGDGPPSQVSLAHRGRRHRRAMTSFVTTKGGEYFLLPSRSALRLLGDLRGD